MTHTTCNRKTAKCFTVKRFAGSVSCGHALMDAFYMKRFYANM